MDKSSRIHKIRHFLSTAEDIGRVLTIIVMTGLVFIQVLLRLMFKWSSPSLEEAARFIMIWSIFIGAIVTTRENSHIRMGGLFKKGVAKKWFEFMSTLVCFVFIIFFTKWAYGFAIYSIEKSMQSIVLRMPLIYVHACFFICSLFITFHFALHLLEQFFDLKILYLERKKI
jgi:TRAP-type C4-dicarboxylate transport system permease small subunit